MDPFPKRIVAAVAAAVLAGGAIGGTASAVIAGQDRPATPVAATAATAGSPVDVSAVVAEVMPSVVEVNVATGSATGVGSGVVLTADGRILTNYHVVAGARDIEVTLADGRSAPATVVDADRTADLAVLQAAATGLTPAALGDSSTARVGDAVIAIGSPAGLRGTVTTGIISAVDRPVTIADGGVSYAALQTDAAINQGNSGGPLFDAEGRVIGINSAIYSPASGSAGSVGIGFSIPINTARTVLDRLV
ncbi:S1C family serine protease [Actinokineospora sp. NPDC004072]